MGSVFAPQCRAASADRKKIEGSTARNVKIPHQQLAVIGQRDIGGQPGVM